MAEQKRIEFEKTLSIITELHKELVLDDQIKESCPISRLVCNNKIEYLLLKKLRDTKELEELKILDTFGKKA